MNIRSTASANLQKQRPKTNGVTRTHTRSRIAAQERSHGMDWVQVWTIIGVIGALTGAVFFILWSEIHTLRNNVRSDIERIERKTDRNSELLHRIEGYLLGIEPSNQ